MPAEELALVKIPLMDDFEDRRSIVGRVARSLSDGAGRTRQEVARFTRARNRQELEGLGSGREAVPFCHRCSDQGLVLQFARVHGKPQFR